MKKLNKAQKKELKEKLLKILHVISYILSGLFILTMVIVGVQSCQKSPKKQSAEALQYENTVMQKREAINLDAESINVYSFNKKSDFGMTAQDETSLMNSYEGIDTSPVSSDDPIETRYLLLGNNTSAYQIVKNEDVYNILSITINFKPILETANTYYYRLYNIACNYYYGDIVRSAYFTEYDGNIGTFYDYSVASSYVSLVLTEEAQYNDNFLYWFSKNDTTSFTFNKVFNYNAPLGTNINGGYGDATFDSSGENMRYINYDVGYFVSNGQIFNRIQYWAIQSGGNQIISDGALLNAPSGYWIYSFMYYINTQSGTEMLVNYHDLIPNPQTATSKYYGNSATWVNDAYRDIVFLEAQTIENEIAINAFNNNNQTSYNGYIGSGDLTNVFGLVGSAFSGLVPILSVYLLPGVTIGMLLFIPLVAMLVFAIIRIIKK